MALLNKLISDIRIEVGDRASDIWQEDEIIRAIQKSVSLMSRLIPKRTMVEGQLDSTWIKDGNYLDISELLDDYIKIERVEYPAGQSPPQVLTCEPVGKYLQFRGIPYLTTGETLRIVYLSTWKQPTISEPGDYPSHLNDVIVIGASGQALIYKAEHYVNESANIAKRIPELLDSLKELEAVELPDIEMPEPPVLVLPDPPTEYTFIKPTPPVFPSTPTPPASISLDPLTPPDWTDFVSTDQGVFDPPAPPALPTPMPTPPSPPNVTSEMADVGTALDAAIACFVNACSTLSSMDSPLSCGAERVSLLPTAITNARAFQTTGQALINAVTVGSDVGALFNQYALTEVGIARESVQSGVAYVQIAGGYEAKAARQSVIGNGYVQEAVQRLGVVRKILDQYATEVNAYRAELDGFIAEVNGTVSIYEAELRGEATGASVFAAVMDGFRTQVADQANQIQVYNLDIQKFLGEINTFAEEVRFLIGVYQAQIQAEVAGIQNYTAQINAYATEIGGEEAKVNIFTSQINAYTAAMQGAQAEASIYATQSQTIKNNIDSCVTQQKQYLELAGRYLASGQAKINEFLAALGYKPEYHRSRASMEQRD